MSSVVLNPRARRGNAAIEFALLLPVVIVMFGSIIDLSLFLTRAHIVQRAARDAARVGSATLEGGTSATGDDIEAAATAQATEALLQAGIPCEDGCTITSEWQDIEGVMVITVNVNYPFYPLTSVLSSALPSNVEAEFTMMTQQQD